MKTYLEEDLALIRKFFPGAKAVTLRTPFDLTVAPKDPWKLRIDDIDKELPQYGDPVWKSPC